MDNPLSHLSKYKIILGSASPRREELLKKLSIPFSIEVSLAEELIPEDLPNQSVPLYLAKEKATQIKKSIAEDHLLITADTIVIKDGKILGKPISREDSIRMLNSISGTVHNVITGVIIQSQEKIVEISDITKVWLSSMTSSEIEWYVDNFQISDKAGSYGIQDWLGASMVNRIEGSYYNVMGLPIDKVYSQLLKWK